MTLKIDQCGDSGLAVRVICTGCGYYFGRKAWHPGTKYEKRIWRCNHKYKGEKKCSTPHFYEDDLKKAFVQAFNQLIGNRDEIMAALRIVMDELMDVGALESDSAALADAIIACKARMAALVEENARKALDQEAYRQQFAGMKAELGELTAKRGKIESELLTRRARRAQIGEFMEKLGGGMMVEFDEEVFRAVVESITVGEDRGWCSGLWMGARSRIGNSLRVNSFSHINGSTLFCFDGFRGEMACFFFVPWAFCHILADPSARILNAGSWCVCGLMTFRRLHDMQRLRCGVKCPSRAGRSAIQRQRRTSNPTPEGSAGCRF